MKKILFLMLSLAVSASAFAGVQKAELSKVSSTPMSISFTKNSRTSVKLTAANAFVKESQSQSPFKATKKIEKGSLRAAVTEQPEGTVKYYQRTGGTALFIRNQYYTPGDQDGYVMTVENGNTVWFKNLLYDPDGFMPDYWIQGTKSGTRINVTLGQEIYNHATYGNLVLGWGNMAIDNGSLALTPITSTTTAVYKINGNNLELQNTVVGTGDYAAYTGTGLCSYWENDNDFGGSLEWNTVMSLAENVPEAPTMYTDAMIDAMTGNMVEYYRTGEAIYYADSLYLGAQGGNAYIFYDADGSTVYMRNPVYGWRNGTWVKGTVSGNKITVPLGQYLTWTSNFVGLKTAWGSLTFPTDTTMEFVQDKTVTDVTYTIDGNKITLDGTSQFTGLATVIDSAYIDFEDNWYPNLDYSTVYYQFPTPPTELTATPSDVTANVAWTDTENNAWNLRYRPYVVSDSYFNDFNVFEEIGDWYVVDADGDGYTWGVIKMDDAGTDLGMYSESYHNETYSALSPDNWLISPLLTLNGIVKFRAFGVDPSYCAEHFTVYLYPGEGEEFTTDDFIAISDEIITDSDQSHEYNFNIPEEYQGMKGRIAIRHHNVSDVFVLVVDDFFVGDPDAAPAPWTVVEGVTNPYTITGLTPETTYEVQVQGVIEAGVGQWTASTLFTTLPEQTGLRGDANDDGVINIQDVTTLISHMLAQDWDNVPGVFNYDNADADLNGTVNIQDVTTLINYLLSKTWPAN